MEIIPSPEKPKRKNDALSPRGNPDLAFGMMFAAALVMVFFQLDNLIGAVGLRAFYVWGSILFVPITSIAIFIFWLNWNVIAHWAGTLVGIFMLVIYTFTLWTMGWIIGGTMRSLPPITPII